MPDDLLLEVLRAAREHGPRPALTDARGRTSTYRELSDRVLGTAHRLRAEGMRTGTRMLFSVRPGPDAIVLALGTVAAGGTVVFIDPGVGPELFASRFALADPGWAAAESLLYAASAPGPLRALARRRGVLLPNYGRLPLRHIRSGPWLPGVPVRAVSTRSLFRAVPGAVPPDPDPDQEAVVVFTSGTTATPKAVVHTRGSLGAALRTLATRCELGPDTRVHTDQMMLGLPALVAGAHWTMPPYGFAPSADPAAVAAGLAGATHTFLVPADLAVILDSGVALPGSLRQVLLGSAPVLPPLLKRAQRALPDVEFLAVYGMTEILPVAIATADEKIGHGGDLLGRPLPGVSARLAPDGELLVSGPNLCRGYLGEPPLTEHATGDLARWDDDRLVLTGRKKDMIIRGRTNVYPGLYEPAIADLPGVAGAVMVGVPDAIGDERIVLVLTALPGTSAGLAQRVRAALPDLIDASALPDEVVLVDELPLAGRLRKIDRTALRERFAR
ncbi:class I adenylate-forming enzyme family protein [Actinosynnema sp. NPDC047251]|uniref:AMP-dependent synthetase and ligase n=1 Tax=Saccharothrix espanaensis (strain ATCC 51144 / DSM 44229 / JCM 9112 / NBRC 15066 / NRRL 15764) TaxID=1179773 RepID=K0JYC3_SACES|nr:class I adenylate-forming enzyme family protein [Saccharothrix espanaensis]CCH31121.1 AMP-dependent synthetase and ligase [Saccharothrix espanaensis DSM 44229]